MKRLLCAGAVLGLVLGGAAACDYYASPTGNGNGLSQQSPFKIAGFWPVAGPGKTLCLMDGVYTDSSSVIKPPGGLNGTSSARITIRALNDGKVRVDGQGVRVPVHLVNNSWFVIEGINAHSSLGTVINISRDANHNTIRRVVAWDAADKNSEIFGSHWNTGTLFEDVAGFGVARKIFQWSQFGNDAICRRCWGRWEASTNVGPKMTYTYAYNNYNLILENVIGTWDERGMPDSYVLTNNGEIWTGTEAGTWTRTEKPNGIIAHDGFTGDNSKSAHAKILGSIAYTKADDALQTHLGGLFAGNYTDSLEFRNVVSYIAPGTHLNLYATRFGNIRTGGTSVVSGMTTVGGVSPIVIGSGWQRSGVKSSSSISAVPSVWNGAGSEGARVCKRYVNGALTNEPLWPWPMNQRILEATTFASAPGYKYFLHVGDPPQNTLVPAQRSPVDVTATMEQIFGPIPAECRRSAGPSSTPHPADANRDFKLSLNEATAYGVCWKSGSNCPPGVSSASLDYAVRAGYLWNASATGAYKYDSTKNCPACWEVAP